MGSNAIIAIVVGAIVVIVGFSLWPVLNGASNNLYSYFRDSCTADGDNGSRFTRIYLGNDAASLPSPLDANAYYTVPGVHGGKGSPVSEDKVNTAGTGAISGGGSATEDDCEVTITVTENLDARITYSTTAATGGISRNIELYNEYGDLVGSLTLSIKHNSTTFATAGVYIFRIEKGDQIIVEELGGVSDVSSLVGIYDSAGTSIVSPVNVIAFAEITNWSGYTWIEVADVLRRFSGINNLLLTILPVISIAGFLGISGAKLYSYGKGASNIGSAISTSIFTLIAIVVAMVIAGPIMGSLVDANQVVESGQYQVNSAFGNIIGLLFSMIPIIYVAGLVTLVGLQAKSALMGNKSGGSMT